MFGVVFLVASCALRVALLANCFAEAAEVGPWGLLKVFAIGLAGDTGTYFCCMLPLVLPLVLIPDRVFLYRPVRYIGLAAYAVAIFLVLFDVVAEWLFWQEFGTRFNFIAIDYLVYTQEVVGNALESYPVKTILSVLLLCACLIAWLTRRYLFVSYDRASTLRRRIAQALVYLAVPGVVLLAGSVDWPDLTANHYANELARNGLFSLATAFRNNSIHYDGLYRSQDPAAAMGRLRQLLKTSNSRYLHEDVFDITRRIEYPGPEKRYNVIILTIESLDAAFLKTFGNVRGLTPNLDELAKQGLLFRKLYATGNRTVRGLEAIATSLPPTPGASVLKRPHCQNMFSAGWIFRQKGYDTKFLYGGSGFFDNMNAFFGGNGFEVVDWSNLAPEEITFRNAWGVCDEDLYNRVIVECDKSFREGKPFFSLVMSTSNHRPYTYPQKVEVLSGTNRRGAVQYTDYAIGQFIRRAKSRPWFDNTIFVVIADHCANSSGKVDVPVDKYHIPLIVYAPGIVRAGECDALCSQMDLVPTLLGVLNMSYTSKFFGRDVLAEPADRALLGTYQQVGLLTRDTLTLLAPNRKVSAWRIDEAGLQAPAATQAGLVEDAIAYYQGASYLLEHQLYDALEAGPATEPASSLPAAPPVP